MLKDQEHVVILCLILALISTPVNIANPRDQKKCIARMNEIVKLSLINNNQGISLI